MADLQKGNPAHVSVFMFLRVNGQSIRDFDGPNGMGPQKVRDLTYFNGAGSQDMLKAVAAQIAHMQIVYIATYFTQQRERAFEDKTLEQLILTLSALLINPAKTVLELAVLVDQIFRFKNEASAAVPVADMTAAQVVPAGIKKRLKTIGFK
jgi:hypothetical protein